MYCIIIYGTISIFYEEKHCEFFLVSGGGASNKNKVVPTLHNHTLPLYYYIVKDHIVITIDNDASSN